MSFGSPDATASAPTKALRLLGGYGFALLASLAAWQGTRLLWPWVAPNIAPLYFVAVLATAWFAGLGPALLTVAACGFFSSYWLPTANPGHFDSGDLLRICTLLIAGLLVSWLNAARARAQLALSHAQKLQAHLQAANEHLQLEVAERQHAQQRALAHQEHLRKLTSELLLAEERERRQIATQLHDTVGQNLAFCQMRLEPLAADNTPLQEVLDLLRSAISHTRSLTRELSPPLLYETRFQTTLEWLAERMRREHGLLIFVNCHGPEIPLGEDLRAFLFQSLRELLINIVKHAGASEAHVTLYRQTHAIRAVVEDNGTGFPDHPEEGFGLLNIRERAVYLGGQLEIESDPAGGSRLTLIVPLRAKDGDAHAA